MPKLWPLVGFGCLRSTPRLIVWEDLYRSLDEGGGEDHDDSLLCRRRSEPKRFIAREGGKTILTAMQVDSKFRVYYISQSWRNAICPLTCNTKPSFQALQPL